MDAALLNSKPLPTSEPLWRSLTAESSKASLSTALPTPSPTFLHVTTEVVPDPPTVAALLLLLQWTTTIVADRLVDTVPVVTATATVTEALAESTTTKGLAIGRLRGAPWMIIPLLPRAVATTIPIAGTIPHLLRTHTPTAGLLMSGLLVTFPLRATLDTPAILTLPASMNVAAATDPVPLGTPLWRKCTLRLVV